MRLTRKYLPVKVIGNSMLPTLRPGDFLMIRIGSGFDIGDLVAAKLDGLADQIVVKRIVDFNDHAYWLSGDNVRESNDSRKFGWVKPDQIIGKVTFKYWPSFKKTFRVN